MKQPKPTPPKIVEPPKQRPSRGAEIVRAMRGTARPGMSTDEIMKLTRE
jgi:hypothetical protein